MPEENLTRDQANAWLRAPERWEPVHESSLKYQAARKEWDEIVEVGRLKTTNSDSPCWWGRKLETHYYAKDGKQIYISKETTPGPLIMVVASSASLVRP